MGFEGSTRLLPNQCSTVYLEFSPMGMSLSQCPENSKILFVLPLQNLPQLLPPTRQTLTCPPPILGKTSRDWSWEREFFPQDIYNVHLFRREVPERSALTAPALSHYQYGSCHTLSPFLIPYLICIDTVSDSAAPGTLRSSLKAFLILTLSGVGSVNRRNSSGILLKSRIATCCPLR